MANALSDITTDADALEVFLKLGGKERIKLREVIEGIAKRIKEFARKLTGVESRILIKDADALKKFAKELGAQLDTAGKQAQKDNAGSRIKYSLNKNAETELYKALYNKNYQGEVLLRDNTPSIMLSHKGVRDLPMTMKASHIRENVFTEEQAKQQGLPISDDINYHGLGDKLFLRVLDGLDNVSEAYRGTNIAENPYRRENYFLLISKFTDSEGNVINVPVYVEQKAQSNRVFFDANKIATVYGKENLRSYLEKEIRKNNLVRIKNRSNKSSESLAPFARDYRDIASTGSISKFNDNVNKNSFADFRHSFGDEEVDMWGLLDPEESGSEEASELLRGYIETANKVLDVSRKVTLQEGAVRRIVNSTLRNYIGKYIELLTTNLTKSKYHFHTKTKKT